MSGTAPKMSKTASASILTEKWPMESRKAMIWLTPPNFIRILKAKKRFQSDSQPSSESPRKQSLQSCSISNTSVMNTKGSNPQEKEEVIELSMEQCNLLLNLFENHGNVNEILINENDMAHPDEGQCISPVTSASNMLEKLLRGNEGNSDASGLEESTESNVGLR